MGDWDHIIAAIWQRAEERASRVEVDWYAEVTKDKLSYLRDEEPRHRSPMIHDGVTCECKSCSLIRAVNKILADQRFGKATR